jgi:ankyrin repeat protein
MEGKIEINLVTLPKLYDLYALSTPIERAWHFDRTKTGLSENNRIILEYMFKAVGVQELAESQQYTTIHKIVLGLSNLDLESQLQDSTSTIDDVDTRGRTALWWAAARGDYETVKTLLEYGASVQDPAVPRSHSALHVAKTSEVVRLLLNHGAKVDCRDESGRTPLHCCAYRGGPRGGSVELFKSLLEGGADVNAQSTAGHTALHYTAMYGFTEHMPLLLARGVPIDSRKPNGTTPLLDAVGCSQPKAVKYLLGRGADPRIENTQRRNIVHIAASRSDEVTMRALASANLRGVDVEANDCFNMTPRQCFDIRQDKSVALEEAFDHLLESCLTKETNVLDIDTDEESDRFEDALESAS